MKVARKYFCWLLVLVMLWTVSLGGCGGSSTSSLSNGDGNNQTSPNGNGNNNENGVEGSIEGTWRIESGTYTGSSNGMNISATYKPGSATAEQFTIAVTDTVKTNDNPYEGDYTITLSGTGVIVNENNLTYIEADFTSDSPYITDEDLKGMMIIQGSKNYNLTGTNNYTWGVSSDGGEGTYTIRLTDSSTLHSIIESTYGGHFVLDVTFKRVEETQTEDTLNTPTVPETPTEEENNSTGLNGTWEILSGDETFTANSKTYHMSYIVGSTRTFTISLTGPLASNGFYTIILSGDAAIDSEKSWQEIQPYIHSEFGFVSGTFSNDDNYPYSGETRINRMLLLGGNTFEYDGVNTYKARSVDDNNNQYFPYTYTIIDDSTVKYVDEDPRSHSSISYDKVELILKRVTKQ